LEFEFEGLGSSELVYFEIW